MGKIYLSVVIPSYNEMVNLQKGVLDKVEHFLSKKSFSYEVIVVDDGSDDGSIAFVEKFTKDNPRFRLLKNSHTGKAGAVTAGMLQAKGEIVLFADMDEATPIEELDKLLPSFSTAPHTLAGPAAWLPPSDVLASLRALDGGPPLASPAAGITPRSKVGQFDIVIGSRSSQRRGAPWTRILMARGMIFLRKIIVGLPGISDTQCGFKAFRRDVAQRLFTRIGRFHRGFQKVAGSSVSAGFDVELLLLAQKMGYKIKEIPVNWLYVETRRVSPIRDSIDGLVDLFKIKLNDLKGKYE